MASKPMKMTTVSLPASLEEEVVEFADSKDISKSAAIRIMINDFLSRNCRKTIVNTKKPEALKS